jgi:2-iminobutanoate/2-iminopropanoate deaminase
MRRQSIEIENLAHNAPIPAARRVGPLLATSAISGKDAATGVLPKDFETQARNAFANLKLILAAADMDVEDVAKVTVFVTDDKLRAKINPFWNECFADEAQRPARHILLMPFRNDVFVQLEVLAFGKNG